MRFKDSFHPYAIITIICWSLAYVYTKLALHFFSALSLGFLRYFIASITLMFVIAFFKLRPPRKKDVLWFLLSGASGFFLYMITFNIGTEYVTSATSSIMIATTPIITALLSVFLYGEKLEAYQWTAVVIEFIGILILTLAGSSFSVNKGIIWLFTAAFLLSSYNLIQRKLTKNYSSLQVSSYSILFGTLMLGIFAPASVKEIQQAPAVQFFYLGILGIFSSVIAYLSWAKAFSKAEKTSQVSNYMFFTPLLTGILGFIIAGEIPEVSTIVGGALVILGFVLFNKKNLSGKSVSRTEQDLPL